MKRSILTYLEDQAKQKGGLSVADYMEICLYHPEWGYYRVRNPLGRDGDFITAPEISQAFGELIGAWHIDLWQRLDKPARFHLIECGPGQGTLMADFLRHAPHDFKEAMKLHLVEINDALCPIQEHSLSAYQPQFHRTIDEALKACGKETTFVLGNEFLDALPVQQFEYDTDGWRERVIFCHEGKLSFGLREELVDPVSIEFPTDVPVGAIFEYNDIAHSIIHHIAKHLSSSRGSALFIDYGPMKSNYGDTLQAVQSHGYFYPLEDPGCADLTAHVDFEYLLKTAQKAGVTTYGPVYQKTFLQELGIRVRMQQLMSQASPMQRMQIEKAIYRLISPSQMGRLFKAISFTHTACPIPAGFSTCSTQAPSSK